jgi:SAM-dependent methyltransferase
MTLHTTRASYDTVAASYADLLRTELDGAPLSRAMLAAFAELVRGAGPVADVGCGPGRVTAHLAALGLDAYGIDLSPGMVAVARRDHPGLRFEEGSMTALDVKDDALAGVLAWYCTVHTPVDELPPVYAEFHRTLAPGGHLLTAFKVGTGEYHLDQAYGHPVRLEVYRYEPEEVAGLLTAAGFEEVARLICEPGRYDKTPQGYVLARKPAAPGVAAG